jgi:hypothetical protein
VAAAEAAEAAKSSGSGGGLVTLVLEGAAMSDFGVVFPHDKCFPEFVQSKDWNTRKVANAFPCKYEVSVLFDQPASLVAQAF